MLFSKCLRAKIYSNMNVYFDPQDCQTLLLKESDPLLFSLGSWTKSLKEIIRFEHTFLKTIIYHEFRKNPFDIPILLTVLCLEVI